MAMRIDRKAHIPRTFLDSHGEPPGHLHKSLEIHHNTNTNRTIENHWWPKNA